MPGAGRAELREIAGIAALALSALAACGRARSPAEDLRSAVPERRAAAVAALGASRDDRDLPILLVAEQDPSPLVRRTAASIFASRGGARAVEALGKLVQDQAPEVAVAAARGLAAVGRAQSENAREAEAQQRQARRHLVAAYGGAASPARAEIAAALDALGTSLREAVESESRQLWDRNVRSLESGTPAERRGAAEELGKSGRSDAVRRLMPLVGPGETTDPMLAAAAARGLAAADARGARPALEELLQAGDAHLAETAAEALGQLGDPAASEALAEAGGAGPTRLASVAVDALSSLPQAPEVGVALCEVAIRSVDAGVAARAAHQARLREADCPDRPLAARIGRRGPESAAGLAALGQLGLSGSRLQPLAQRALAVFTAPGGEPSLRAAAARALGLVGWTPAVPALSKAGQALVQEIADARRKWLPGRLAPAFSAGTPPDADAVAARPAPAPTGGDGGAPPEWIDDVDPADAAELGSIAVALAALRAEGALALAASLATDADAALRAASVEATALLGGDAARARVAEALSDSSPKVRLAAAAALPRFGGAAVPALAEAVRRSAPGDGEWPAALARALGDTGSPAAVPALAALLAGSAAPVAAAALGRLGSRDGARPLAELLDRGQSLGRVEAIEALGQIGAAEAGASLVRELTSDRPEVREAAVRALGKLRDEAASSRLEALRSDYYVEVRRAAVEALAKLPASASGRR